VSWKLQPAIGEIDSMVLAMARAALVLSDTSSSSDAK
jgi:hypothetical protein